VGPPTAGTDSLRWYFRLEVGARGFFRWPTNPGRGHPRFHGLARPERLLDPIGTACGSSPKLAQRRLPVAISHASGISSQCRRVQWVKHLELQLREPPDTVHLKVTDLGRGFDVEAAKQSRGLGLTSMNERARLVNETITIDSKPMSGTSIHTCIPLKSSPQAQVKAG